SDDVVRTKGIRPFIRLSPRRRKSAEHRPQGVRRALENGNRGGKVKIHFGFSRARRPDYCAHRTSDRRDLAGCRSEEDRDSRSCYRATLLRSSATENPRICLIFQTPRETKSRSITVMLSSSAAFSYRSRAKRAMSL